MACTGACPVLTQMPHYSGHLVLSHSPTKTTCAPAFLPTLHLVHFAPWVVFTKELSKRLGDAAIVADADPGFVASDIWRNNPLMVRSKDA
eukprot:473450-Prorocentrum_minimum.AAC.1